MPGETLSCPNCQARLRRAPGLEPGTAVACPRCQAQFTAPDDFRPYGSPVPEPRFRAHDPGRSPDPRPAYRADTDDPDYPRRTRPFRRAVTLHLRIICVLQLFAVFGSLLAAFAEIRNIVGGGPLISFLGLYIAVLSFWSSFRPGVRAGLSAPALSVLVLVLINLFGWSPDEASAPVRVMGSLYAIVVIPVLLCIGVFPRFVESAGGRVPRDPRD